MTHKKQVALIWLSLVIAIAEGFLGFVPNSNGKMANYNTVHAFISGIWFAVFLFRAKERWKSRPHTAGDELINS